MIDGGSISVSGQITSRDVACFSYFSMLRRWWLLAFVFLLLAALFVQALASGEDEAFFNAIPFFLVGIFWAWVIIYLPRRSARKVMVTQAAFREPITWAFSPEAIRVQTCVSESELKWPVFYKVCETGSCFLLFVSSQRRTHWLCNAQHAANMNWC